MLGLPGHALHVKIERTSDGERLVERRFDHCGAGMSAVDDQDAARLSSLIAAHLNVDGRYTFTQPTDDGRHLFRDVAEPAEEEYLYDGTPLTNMVLSNGQRGDEYGSVIDQPDRHPAATGHLEWAPRSIENSITSSIPH